MKRTLVKLALVAAIAGGIAGCVYEPAPYYAQPAPAYGYYGPAYYGPAVSFNYRAGGYNHWHGRD